uniref:NADH-ubiquinone oxidoreductase chain 3 n=1 Tax=Cryptopone sauteri TaxID=255801 RepID=A0A411HSF4_9HYME|nr:NADH dehydrogenase subunit 3 [Cryptopone sauteri]QBB73599.1 NADH dehydrogenase subunit 3 [Cryptopone sauteri]
MYNLLNLLLLFFMICSFLFILNIIFSMKMFKKREKNSSFECGFDPISNPRVPFSIQFFLISLMFLIFDIEITLLIPLIYSFMNFNFFMILSFLFFLLILILSIYFEYLENMFEWKI